MRGRVTHYPSISARIAHSAPYLVWLGGPHYPEVEGGIRMPVYEFVCKDCNTRFDALVRNFKAADEVTCRGCESGNVRRMVSTFAVSGFDDTLVATGPL